VSLSAKAGSSESLKCRQQCGLRLCIFQMPCPVGTAMPATFAIAGSVQWVVSCGGGSCVRRMISTLRWDRRLAGRAGSVVAARIAEVPTVTARKHNTRSPEMFLKAHGVHDDRAQSLMIGRRIR
jgi:hypothetical protein